MNPLIAFVVFAIAGPPIGSLILLGVIAIAMAVGPEGLGRFGGNLGEFSKGVALVALLSYLFGGLQALVVAIVAATAQASDWSGRASFLAVVVAGFVTGLGSMLFIMANSNMPFLSIQSSMILGIHIGAAIGCWLITQGIFRLVRRAAGRCRVIR